MVTLRLFASLREIAQTSRLELDADSVGDALDQAVARFGDRFARSLATAQIWVNGDKAGRETPLNSGDEMALIPPVSGGAATLQETTDPTRLAFTATLGVTVLIGNLISAEALAFAAVGAMIAWLWDVADAYAARQPALQLIPAMAAATAGASAAYRWGQPGLAGGVALGIMLALAWTVFDRTNRRVEAFAVSVLLAGVAALGSGSLVIVRLRSVTETSAFLAIAAVAAVAAWAGRRFGGASLDSNLAIGRSDCRPGARLDGAQRRRPPHCARSGDADDGRPGRGRRVPVVGVACDVLAGGVRLNGVLKPSARLERQNRS